MAAPGTPSQPATGARRVLDDLTMRSKILAIVLLAVVVTGTCVAVGARALTSSAASTKALVSEQVGPSLDAANAARHLARYRRLVFQLTIAHTPEQTSRTVTDLATEEAYLDDAVAGLVEVAGGEGGAHVDRAAAVETAWVASKEYFHASLESDATALDLSSGQSLALSDRVVGEFATLTDTAVDALDDIQAVRKEATADAVASGEAQARRALLVLAATAVGGTALLLLVGLWMASAISARLSRVRDALDDLGGGDLRADLAGMAAKDEVGQMATALTTSLSSLRSTMTTIENTSTTIAGSAEELSAVSSQVATSAEETSAESGSAAATAEQVSRSVQTVAAGTEQMSASIREIASSSAEAVRVAQSAADEAVSATTTVSKLGESSREVGDVVKVITSIAEQTNLLALNATIEAARAGEAGKGFAVVANEVKDLAGETARATDDISRRIAAIQADSDAAVAAIARISEIIIEVNSYQTTIAAAVEEQTATTAEMGRSVAEASDGAQGIAGSIEHVASAAQASSAGIAEAQRSAADLAQISTQLRGLVGQFRL